MTNPKSNYYLNTYSSTQHIKKAQRAELNRMEIDFQLQGVVVFNLCFQIKFQDFFLAFFFLSGKDQSNRDGL